MMHYAFTFDLDENWIGGSFYIRNLISALGALPKAEQPHVTILGQRWESYRFLKETGYEKLFWIKRAQFDKQPDDFPFDAIFPWPISGQEFRCVSWIPDFQDLNLTSFFSRDDLATRQQFHRLCFTSSGLIVSSEAVKNDLEHYYPGECNNVRIVRFAAFNNFNFSRFAEVAAKYEIRQPYVICPNQVWIHKNHIVLIKAVALLKARGINISVYFTGNESDYRVAGFSATLKEVIVDLELDDRIRFLGFIPREDQLILMKGARYIVQPSLFEGWSTVIEDAKAMQQYVVASDLDVHKEQLPVNGSFFERSNPDSLAELMAEFHINPPKIASTDYGKAQLSFGRDFIAAIDSFINGNMLSKSKMVRDFAEVELLSAENISSRSDSDAANQTDSAVVSAEFNLYSADKSIAGFQNENRLSLETAIDLMFDANWYAAENGFGALSPKQLREHFIKFGMYQNLAPSLLFDPDFYINKYPEVLTSGKPAFVHFVESGLYNKLQPIWLFDPDFYQEQSKSHDPKFNPFLHFLEEGLASNLSPHPLFDPSHYARNFVDAANSDIPLFVHYLRIGLNAGYSPHPLFDPILYAENHPELRGSKLLALKHFLYYGLKGGDQPHILFDPVYYARRYPDSTEPGVPALIHYLKYGMLKGYKPHFLFDSDLYYPSNKHIEDKSRPPILHYTEYGINHGCWPHPLFDPKFYLQQYPDVAESGQTALKHYLLYGIFENRKPHALFDPEYYLRRYPDVAHSNLPAFQHFIEFGIKEQRAPNRYFCTIFYLNQCVDLGHFTRTPFVHYLLIGQYQHLCPGPTFDPTYYLRKYSDIDQDNILPLHHFLLFGEKEGRFPNLGAEKLDSYRCADPSRYFYERI